MQHSIGTTGQDISGRFNEGQCMSIQNIARCCRRERTVCLLKVFANSDYSLNSQA